MIDVAMRVLRPHPCVYAFYDGRVEGRRFADQPNWVDVGALSLGIASYAILDGDEALVYDTHISVTHGRWIRETLHDAGARSFTVVLSHWHLDHVAGTEAFADCAIIANARTAEILAHNRVAIEAGTLEGPPAIRPLVVPTRTFVGAERLRVGTLEIELLALDIHSDDATVVWWPDRRLLLAGDTLEDTLTYLDMPDHLDQHVADLRRLRALRAEHILPNHGDPDRIAAGGYSIDLIDATTEYLDLLRRTRTDEALRAMPVRELLAAPLAAGAIKYWPGYEDVHGSNLQTIRRLS